jgi:hypothetical protein
VDPSSERAALKPLLEQPAAAGEQMPTTVLLDAGFVSFPVLALRVERNIDVLGPTGQAPSVAARANANRSTNGASSTPSVAAIGLIAALGAVIVRCASAAPSPSPVAR